MTQVQVLFMYLIEGIEFGTWKVRRLNWVWLNEHRCNIFTRLKIHNHNCQEQLYTYSALDTFALQSCLSLPAIFDGRMKNMISHQVNFIYIYHRF